MFAMPPNYILLFLVWFCIRRFSQMSATFRAVFGNFEKKHIFFTQRGKKYELFPNVFPKQLFYGSKLNKKLLKFSSLVACLFNFHRNIPKSTQTMVFCFRTRLPPWLLTIAIPNYMHWGHAICLRAWGVAWLVPQIVCMYANKYYPYFPAKWSTV